MHLWALIVSGLALAVNGELFSDFAKHTNHEIITKRSSKGVSFNLPENHAFPMGITQPFLVLYVDDLGRISAHKNVKNAAAYCINEVSSSFLKNTFSEITSNGSFMPDCRFVLVLLPTAPKHVPPPDTWLYNSGMLRLGCPRWLQSLTSKSPYVVMTMNYAPKIQKVPLPEDLVLVRDATISDPITSNNGEGFKLYSRF